MQLHTLRPKTKRKTPKYIGRGGKRGTTSGKGTKGQKARSGHKLRPDIRDVIKRIPKLRGYRFRGLQKPAFAFDLDTISKNFQAGDIVNTMVLAQKGLLPRAIKAKPSVKILGEGVISKKITFEGVKCSASAREKILAAGGVIK